MQLNKHTLQRILFFSGVASLIIVYVLSWVDVITDPSQRTASDFMAFYAAGRSALEHTLADAYDVAYTKANEEKVLGYRIADRDVNFLVHPPLVLPILWLIAHFEYVPAFYLWASFLLILCGLCAQMTVKLFKTVQGVNRLVLWCGTFLFFPLYISVVNGQTSAMLLLGVLLWYYGFTKNSNHIAGLGLALATISPQIALILAVPFLFSPAYRKVWWWFCLGAGTLATISVAMVGIHGVQNYLHVLTLSASGEDYHTHESAMVNLIGLLKRMMPNLDSATIRTTGWIVSLLGLISLCAISRRLSSPDDKFISLSVIVAIFATTHLHYHDLALLLVPMLIVIRKLAIAQNDLLGWATLLPIGISLLFALTYSVPQFTYLVIYLVELVLLVSPWLLQDQYKISPSPGAE